MVGTGPASCALALRWPSPRLKLGGATTVANGAGGVGSESYELSCYLTARPGYRTTQRLGSPTPLRPQRSARTTCESSRVSQAVLRTPREQRQQPAAQQTETAESRSGEAAPSEEISLRLPPVDATQRSSAVASACSSRQLVNSAPLSSQAMAFHKGADLSATAPAAGGCLESLHEPDAAAGSGKEAGQFSDGNVSPGLEASRRHRGASPEGELDDIVKSHVQRSMDEKTSFHASLNIPGNIENICRSSFQAANEKRGELEHALAWRRREQYAQVRHQTRQKASTWMRKCKERQHQDLLRIQKEQEALEDANRRALELSEKQNKNRMRELKFADVKERLESEAGSPRRKRRTTLKATKPLSEVEMVNEMVPLRRTSQKAQSVFTMGNPRKSTGNSTRASTNAISHMFSDTTTDLDREALSRRRGSDNTDMPNKIVEVPPPRRSTARRASTIAKNLQERLSLALLEKAAPALNQFSMEASTEEEPAEPAEKFELPPVGPPSANQRIENMRRAQKLKARADRRAQEEAGRKAKFEELSFQQREDIQLAFGRYDRQGTLGLDSQGLRNAILELGLRGCCAAEWRAIKLMCEAAAPTKKKEGDRQKVGCDLYRFAIDVMPEIQRSLLQYRKDKIQRLVAAQCRTDWEDNTIDLDDVFQCVLQCWPVAVEVEGSRADEELHEKIRSLLRGNNGENPDFNVITPQIARVVEDHQQQYRALQRHLQAKYDLDDELFAEFRAELISFHALFVNIDLNAMGGVSSRDTIYLFKELDLLDSPGKVKATADKKKSEADTWQARAVTLITDSETISFRRFLELTREISELKEAYQPKAKSVAEAIGEAFDKHCVDEENFLEPFVAPDQLPVIFKEVRIEADPEYPRGQVALTRLLAEADIDGSGHLTLEMVRKHCRVASLQLRLQDVLTELDFGQLYGFGFNEVRDMHGVFQSFDTDNSGTLDQFEVQEAIQLLKLDCASTRENYFSVAFSMLDEDGSGALDFFEFMHLIQRVRDKEGIFKSEDSPIATLKDLDRMDLLLTLDCFDIDARDWEDSACAHRLHQLLEVDSSTYLKSVLHVETLADLFAHCRWRHEYLQNEQRRLNE